MVMRTVLMVVGLLLSAGSWGQDKFDLMFDRVPIYELVRLVYADLLKEPVVIDGLFSGSQKLTSVDLRGASMDQVRVVLGAVLDGAGLSVRVLPGGINVLESRHLELEDREVFVYRPRFRTVAYLEGAMRAFLSRGRFGGSSGSGGVGGSGLGGAVGASGAAGAPGGAVAVAGGGVSVTSPGVLVGGGDVVSFQGPGVEVASVRDLLGRLDVPVRQVLIRASVFEVQASKDTSSSVALAFSILNGLLSYGVGGIASSSVRIKGGWDVAVSKLAGDSRFKLLSSPSLRVSSGESARVVVGQDVPVLGSVTLPGGGAAPIQSVNYQSSGVMLDINATALSDSVQLVLKQEISDFSATLTGVNGSPTLLKRSLASSIALGSGDVVFLGGLDQKNNSVASGGASWVPDWMRSHTGAEASTELVVMLQADVLP